MAPAHGAADERLTRPAKDGSCGGDMSSGTIFCPPPDVELRPNPLQIPSVSRAFPLLPWTRRDRFTSLLPEERIRFPHASNGPLSTGAEKSTPQPRTRRDSNVRALNHARRGPYCPPVRRRPGAHAPSEWLNPTSGRTAGNRHRVRLHSGCSGSPALGRTRHRRRPRHRA